MSQEPYLCWVLAVGLLPCYLLREASFYEKLALRVWCEMSCAFCLRRRRWETDQTVRGLTNNSERIQTQLHSISSDFGLGRVRLEIWIQLKRITNKKIEEGQGMEMQLSWLVVWGRKVRLTGRLFIESLGLIWLDK